jgi:hypothetical protein
VRAAVDCARATTLRFASYQKHICTASQYPLCGIESATRSWLVVPSGAPLASSHWLAGAVAVAYAYRTGPTTPGTQVVPSCRMNIVAQPTSCDVAVRP